MSYQVKLRLRLEDIQAHSVPKQCSSCFARQAPERRMVMARYNVKRGENIQWSIQLPLCKACHDLVDVLQNYRPSKHGPPDRAKGNRRTALVLVLLSLAAIAILLAPYSLITAVYGLDKAWVSGVLGAVFIGAYLWNYRANERARLAVYQEMVGRAGHTLGDVQITKGRQGPILIFDNEDYGNAFAKSNKDLLVTGDEQPDLDDQITAPEPRWKRLVRVFVNAFRIR